jgi:2-polyprenyl-6-methoxyphenol hydroxylase-like FAD-dependent oxidoreductase
MDMSQDDFNRDVEQRLNGRLGKIQQTGERYPYPLVAVHANRFYANRFALIGDAAVGMHPVTAHGFNLGLSGQNILAEEITHALAKGQAFWSPSLLQRYQRKHMLATRPLFHGTNQVVTLFTNDSVPAKLLRKATMHLSNNLPPVKWAIRQKLMTKKQIHSLLPPLPPGVGMLLGR